MERGFHQNDFSVLLVKSPEISHTVPTLPIDSLTKVKRILSASALPHSCQFFLGPPSCLPRRHCRCPGGKIGSEADGRGRGHVSSSSSSSSSSNNDNNWTRAKTRKTDEPFFAAILSWQIPSPNRLRRERRRGRRPRPGRAPFHGLKQNFCTRRIGFEAASLSQGTKSEKPETFSVE